MVSNKFLPTTVLYSKGGAKLKICYSLSSALQGDSPLWTEHMQCWWTFTDIFHPYVRVSSPSQRVGACRLVSLAWGREWVPRKKRKINTNFGGDSFFWAYRYQIMQGMSLKIPTTGWHLTSHCLASELTVVAEGADLVHTWNSSLTISATGPRDLCNRPKLKI